MTHANFKRTVWFMVYEAQGSRMDYFAVHYDHSKRPLLLVDYQIRITAQGVIGDIERLIPGISKQIEEVRVYRWGHPMVPSSVGVLTRIRPLATKPLGNILFAHSDSQMAAAVECAIWEGKKNARVARKIVARG